MNKYIKKLLSSIGHIEMSWCVKRRVIIENIKEVPLKVTMELELPHFVPIPLRGICLKEAIISNRYIYTHCDTVHNS